MLGQTKSERQIEVTSIVLQRLLVGFSVLRWTITAAWIAAFASLDIGQNGQDTKYPLLVVSAVLAAVCTATLCITLISFGKAIVKVTTAKQSWWGS